MKRLELVLLLVVLLTSFVSAEVCSSNEAISYLAAGSNYEIKNTQSVDYVLIIDKSGSMRGEKIAGAKQAAVSLVEQVAKQDRVAVVSFDSRDTLQQDFTSDKEALIAAINNISVGDFTNYAASLNTAFHLFNGNRRVVVFLSDGKPDDDREVLDESVSRLIGDDVCLFTIAYTSSAEQQAQEILQGIAEESQRENGCGGYFRAGQNSFELQFIFSQIYKEVSADEVLDVEASVSTYEGVTFSVNAVSKLNQRPIFEVTCFEPEINILIVQNNEVIEEITINNRVYETNLSAGDYVYYVTVRETCGGNCLFTGDTTGRFTVDASQAACVIPWEELEVLLTNTEYVEIHITANGFSPQITSTEGAVVWRNLDDKPHRIIGLQGGFTSPVLRPGDTWKYVFPPGSYSYSSTGASFSGSMSNEYDEEQEPVDLVLVIDRSGSMAGEPLASAKAAASSLLSILTAQDRASLIVFSDKARSIQQLTSDISLLMKGVDSITSQGSTFYSEAIELAGNQIMKSSDRRNKAILFLSDGAPYDEGGKDQILRTLDEHIEDACFYAIGYGDQSAEASSLLTEMAQQVQAKNGCGIYYFSTANKVELSRVFGEIYALTRKPGLEIFDISVPEEAKEEFELIARVRSTQNGVLVPSNSQFGCVPEAEVVAVFGNRRFPLEFKSGSYQGSIKLPPGEYSGTIIATLVNPYDSSKTIVGSTPVEIRIKGGTIWIYVGIVVFVLLISNLFIRWRTPKKSHGHGSHKTVSEENRHR